MKELVKRRSTERGKAMASTTLAPTLNTPLSDLRPATMDRILVIADDSALRNALHRLFSLDLSNGMRSRWSPIASLGWRDFVKDHSPQWSSNCSAQDRRDGTFAGRLRIRFPVSRLSFLAQAPMLPTRSFCWKWAPMIA